MKLKVLLGTLVLANGLFFAWSQDVLAPHWPGPLSADREPQRLQAQRNPELVLVLNAPAASAALAAFHAQEAASAASAAASAGSAAAAEGAASAGAAASAASAGPATAATAPAAPPVCRVLGPVTEAALAAAEAKLAEQLGGVRVAAQRSELPAPKPWAVFGGRVLDPAAMEQRVANARRHKIEPEILREPAALAPGIVLSRHATQAEAEAAMEKLPFRGLKVVALPRPASRWLLRVDAVPAARAAALDAAGYHTCSDGAA